MRKLICLLIFVLFASCVSAAITDDLVYVYDHEETTGALTDKVEGVVNSVSEVVNSKTAAGINLNAWNYTDDNGGEVIMPNNVFFRDARNLTVFVWFWLNNTSPDRSYIITSNNDDTVISVFNDGVYIINVNGNLWDSDKVAPLKTWQSMAFTYDGSNGNISYFVNGYHNNTILVSPATITDSNGPIAIGVRSVGGLRTFSGMIDEIMIWNRSLLASEIFSLAIEERFWPDFLRDLIPPNLLNAICTSCFLENQTIDSTPTINVTCIDNLLSCQGVRIANDSSFNYTNATSTRKCTSGIGNFICTLPASDALSQTNENQTIYFWANDTNGNSHGPFNLSINLSFVIDTTKPSFANLTTNATSLISSNNFQFNATFTDNVGLFNYIFSWNGSGSWVNFSTAISGDFIKHYSTLENRTTIVDGNISYRWYINDTSANVNVTKLFNFSVIEKILLLDGIKGNGTYEYETTANINTTLLFIDILDNTFRWLNQVTNFNYTIDTLRENKINGSTFANISSAGGIANVSIDSRTELYNAKIDLIGMNNPMNVTLNYTDILNFPGMLLGEILFQDKFIYSDTLYSRVNITFTTAGSNIFYINYSNQGDLSISDYLNFTITAYNLDEGNDLDLTEKFNNSQYINLTALRNTSGPMSILDDFENNNRTHRYTWSSGCSAARFVDGYLAVEGANTDCKVTFDDFIMDNVTRFNFTALVTHTHTCGHTCSGTSTTAIIATDGTNEVNLFFEQGAIGFPSSTGASLEYNYWSGVRDGNKWTIYRNETQVGQGDVSSLDSPITLIVRASFLGDSQTTGQNNWRIYEFNTSGIRLNSTNGIYSKNGSFESSCLFNGTSNIARVLISVSEHHSDNTSITYSTSNNNGSIYERFTPFNWHTFDTVGSCLKVKFNLTSFNSSGTPYIPTYRAQIVPSSLPELIIDVGNDGITDMYINDTLNSTTTPVNYIGNDTGFNDYINRTCLSDSYCLVPVSLTAGGGGVVEVSNVNRSKNINPISFNITLLQDLNLIPIQINYTGGTIQINDVKFDFRGSKNITVVAHSGDYSDSRNATITVRDSNFNLSYPSGQNMFITLYNARNQSNAEPFGQNSTHGIWRIDSLAYDSNINVYSHYNESVATCITKREFRGNNYSFSESDGLVAYYKFNENSSRDYSRENNDGTVSGAFWNSTGGINDTGGFEFDGSVNTYINLSNNAVNGLNNFTFLVWFKMTESVSVSKYIISGANSTQDNQFLIGLTGAPPSRINMFLNGESDSSPNTIYFNDGLYHHIAVRRADSNLSYFLNGTFFGSSLTNSLTVDIDANGLFLGQEQDSLGSGFTTAQAWNGSLDEVSIFNRSLSASEINTIYLATKTQYFSNATIANLTTTSEIIMENLDSDDVDNTVFAKTMINCSGSTNALIDSWFCIFSICSECVKTRDWDSNCEDLQ